MRATSLFRPPLSATFFLQHRDQKFRQLFGLFGLQVQIAQVTDRNQLLLENGDVLRISCENGLVLTSGEVLFPNAVAFDKRMCLAYYINRAGGYTQSADNSRVVVARRYGSIEQTNSGNYMSSVNVHAVGQVLVLLKVDEKFRHFWKDMS